jgi:translation initiation factor 1A
MAKNKGGNTQKKLKNKNFNEKRELYFKEAGEEYAKVLKMLGDGRVEAQCYDGIKRLCRIRKRSEWISTGDIILVGLRDYQDSKADILMKYTPEEVRKLISYNQIPEEDKKEEEECGFKFEDKEPIFSIDEI